MTDTSQQSVALTTEQRFYRIELTATGQPTCQCENCQLWTVVYDDGEPTEIGTSWQGADGQETAEDICDLMNLAYYTGRTSIETARVLLHDASAQTGEYEISNWMEKARTWVKENS
jgi:hypothetical protein